MAKLKQKLLSALAKFTRSYDIRGTLRLMRFLHPVSQTEDSAIKTVINYDNGVRMRIDTSSFIEWVIFFKGYYNLGLTRFIHKFLGPGKVAVDVGTNIGQHALVMCRLVGPEGRVYMFEPQPEVRDRLEANMALNGFKNATVSSSALSDRVGTAELHSFAPGTANQGNATLAPTNHPDLSRSIAVEVDTLDNVFRRTPPGRLDFIKIDTQGNDVAVLSGAAETIAKFRPRITVRYDSKLYGQAGKTYADLKKIFDSHRYRTYVLRKRGLSPIEPGSEVPSEVVCAVPEEEVNRENPRSFEV